MEFVFDTYAIIEVIKGNENYTPYLNSRIIINNFIFAELCYILIRNNFPNPEKYLKKYGRFVINSSPQIISEAMKFRYENKKKRLSITGCISYFQARDLGIKFLTGDKEFESLDNVEFVK